MNATTVTANAIQSPAAWIDHAALDAILSHMERRYGLDPRLDRAYRVVVSDRIELSVVDPKAGLVHGDSGPAYWATADGFCECPDAERVARCNHALAVIIAVQLAAAAQSKASHGDDARVTYARLTREHQEHGRELIAAGTRPIDDTTYRDRDDRIQALRLQLPAVSLIR
jgi:hypothetical protein